MMLKTSSRKINPFCNMLWFTIRKNLGIIVVLCIASLLYYPGTFIVNYENLLVSAENNHNNYLLENFGNAITIFSSSIVVLFNMLNFSFLYKKSSSDVFHAFPLTRSELLLSRFLSGIVATFIPTLLCYASFGVLMSFNSWMASFTEFFYYLIHTIIIVLVCSSFSMIFVVSAGTSFDLGVSLIGGNLALIAVGWIFESILDETLVGYNGYHISEIIYNLSPPYFCGVGLGRANDIKQNGITSQSIEFFIRSAVYIVVFTIVSLLLYNRRKAEKGGSAYAYKFMYLGCSILAGICGGFLLGMIFIGNITAFGFWIFAVIGCLLTTVIYGTISNRGFKGVVKSIIMGAVSAVVLIGVAISGVTGGFGYTNRIPQTNKIKNVSISAFGEEIPFDDPELIIDLHRAIIDTNATDYDYDYDLSYGYIENVKFYYELKNGKTMSRSFTFDTSKVSSELLNIYQSQERINMIKESVDVVNAERINLYFYYNDEYYNADIDYLEMQEFLQSYWQDVQNCDKAIFNDRKDYEFIELFGDKKLDNNRSEWFGFQFEWNESFTNTKQFIENKNLVERSKQQDETYKKY